MGAGIGPRLTFNPRGAKRPPKLFLSKGLTKVKCSGTIKLQLNRDKGAEAPGTRTMDPVMMIVDLVDAVWFHLRRKLNLQKTSDDKIKAGGTANWAFSPRG